MGFPRPDIPLLHPNLKGARFGDEEGEYAIFKTQNTGDKNDRCRGPEMAGLPPTPFFPPTPPKPRGGRGGRPPGEGFYFWPGRQIPLVNEEKKLKKGGGERMGPPKI